VCTEPRRAWVLLAIEARRHRPVPALFRIPAERQFLKSPAFREVQIAPAMIAGADHIIDSLLVDVRLLAIETLLPAPLIILAVTLDHFEICVRRCMVKRLAKAFDGGLR